MGYTKEPNKIMTHHIQPSHHRSISCALTKNKGARVLYTEYLHAMTVYQ